MIHMEKKVWTNEELQEKADELAKVYNCKIHPLSFMTNEGKEQIVGFMKEPPRFVKYRVLDKSMSAAITAAAECLEAVLIKEHSDARIWSENQEYDDIHLGACIAASAIIKYSANQFKKN